MSLVKSVKLIEGYNNLEDGYEINDLLPITLLVGDQGVGKSSLLYRMGKRYDPNKTQVTLVDPHQDVTTYFFDSESMNPRTADIEANYTNIDGTSKGIGVAGALASRFKSHGEVLLSFTVHGIKKAENCIMFFDEPESALSVRSQLALIEAIKDAAENRNCQFVIATHCMPLIESQEKVYSMEHNKWMTSKEFIDSQRNPRENKGVENRRVKTIRSKERREK